jgi:hypothetical protein
MLGCEQKAGGGCDQKAGGRCDQKARGGCDQEAGSGCDQKAGGRCDQKAAGRCDQKAGGRRREAGVTRRVEACLMPPMPCLTRVVRASIFHKRHSAGVPCRRSGESWSCQALHQESIPLHSRTRWALCVSTMLFAHTQRFVPPCARMARIVVSLPGRDAATSIISAP